MRATLAILAVLAFASAASATRNPPPDATHVMARIEYDNKVEQVSKQIDKVRANIAKELCNVPVSDVTIVKVLDDSTKVMGVGDTQSLVYAACKAPLSKLEAVLDDCEDLWNRHQSKDELADKTSFLSGGELDVDDIDCEYVRANKFEFFESKDAKKAAAQGQGSAAGATVAAAAATVKSGAAGAAAPVVAAAAAAAAVLALVA